MKTKGKPATRDQGGALNVEHGWAMPTFFKVLMALIMALMILCLSFSIITDGLTFVLAGIFAIILLVSVYMVIGNAFVRFHATEEYNTAAYRALCTCKAISGQEAKELRDRREWHSMIDTGEVEIRTIKRADGREVKRAYRYELKPAFQEDDITQFYRAYKSARITMDQLDSIKRLPGLSIPTEEDMPTPVSKQKISEEDKLAQLERTVAELTRKLESNPCGTPQGCGEEEQAPPRKKKKKRRPGRPPRRKDNSI